MDDGLSPRLSRLLRWILPAEFVRRVAAPAYNDLLVGRLEQGRPALGWLSSAWFVLDCLWAAFPRTIFHLRRVKVLAAVLATAVVALIIVRQRMAYGAASSPQQRSLSRPSH